MDGFFNFFFLAAGKDKRNAADKNIKDALLEKGGYPILIILHLNIFANRHRV